MASDSIVKVPLQTVHEPENIWNSNADNKQDSLSTRDFSSHGFVEDKKAITKVFKEFNKFCMGLKLFSKSYISIDGSKFKAVNAKDNNLTLSNSPTDHGQLTSVASEVKADYGVDVLESTADMGYECPEDHADALANGIVPNLKS